MLNAWRISGPSLVRRSSVETLRWAPVPGVVRGADGLGPERRRETGLEQQASTHLHRRTVPLFGNTILFRSMRNG